MENKAQSSTLSFAPLRENYYKHKRSKISLRVKIERFNKKNFHAICDQLASKDKDLRLIVDTHGYPPMWTRPNSFETLVHIILEQQVSLASALAALNKLREFVGVVTPEAAL